MNKLVIAGIVIAIAIGIIAMVTSVEDNVLEDGAVENQSTEPPAPVGKNLRIELSEGIGVEGNP